MTFTPVPSLRHTLTDGQRATLATFEQTAMPTDMQRGALNALRLCSASTADQARIEAVRVKWAKGRKP